MNKSTFLVLLACTTFSQVYSQPIFNRSWGSVKEHIYKPSIAEINPSTGDLFVFVRDVAAYPTLNEIHKISRNNASSNLVYQFPAPIVIPGVPPDATETTIFDNFKIDNTSNIIIIGRTFKPGLATSGAYSSQMIQDSSGGPSGFIMKIRSSGQVVWFTYFNALSQNTEQLTIDNNNNIYVVSKRNKNDVLSGSVFQNSGDHSSNTNVQDVISKFDTNGKHLWSTFYVKDDSRITAIEAGHNALYVYGEHFGSSSKSNYFGTKNSYQEYASGVVMWNQPSSSSTTFLSKFNFNGTRAWSTYFGNEISKSVYNSATMNVKSLKVIGDDAYFLTKHTIVNSPSPSIATANTFLTSPPSNLDPVTLTKVNDTGKREWTTYLFAGETLSKTVSENGLHLSAMIENSHPNLSLLTDSQSYQNQHNGFKDVYSYTMTLDGKKVNYTSFYGFEGEDTGFSFPTVEGYYVMGRGSKYSNATMSFTTAGSPSVPFTNSNDGYTGNFIGFFTNKGLSTSDAEAQSHATIYPNPVLETLNIQTSEPLTEDTQIIVFDVSGKKVLATYAKATELNQLNVSTLNSGVYILQLSSANMNQSYKFIKK